MKKILNRWMSRANTLQSRERWVLTGCLCLVMWFVIDLVWTAPNLEQSAQFRSLADVQTGEVARVQEELAGLRSGSIAVGDPILIDKLASIEREQQALDAGLRAREEQLLSPQGMADLVQALMREDSRLQLVAIRNLPTAALVSVDPVLVQPEEAVMAEGAPTPAATPAVVQVAAQRNLYRHGIELRLRGEYLDVLSYLQKLESLPYPLYWGRLEMRAAAWPTLEFLVTLNTLSTEAAWLKL